MTFPLDYRAFITASGRLNRVFGGSYLMLYGINELVSVNRGFDLSASHPGLVFFGSDGGGEGVGFDFRSDPPRIVLVNWISDGWEEAIHQADTFTEFMTQRNSGQEYKFD